MGDRPVDPDVLEYLDLHTLQEPKMARNERTSKRVARQAGKLLGNPKSPKRVKTVAASALTQAPDRKKPKRKGKK